MSAVEFALVAPILLLMLVGLTDFGLAVNEKMRLVNAVRAGVQAGYGNSTDVAAITQAVKDASGLDAAAIAVSVATSCGCADGSSVVCGGICADASSLRTYVTVTVTESYALLISYPGFASPMTLSATATLRVN
ncbi:MAG: TadE/TadG family type IV pilus assembly protein [Phaeospirillum sp.]|nr:TadE/TadG family type IV pilus assembly protein [Phaeospirillum sp.]